MTPVPRPLRLFLAVLLALTVLCALTEVVCSFILHWTGSYTWPLTPAPELFYDLNGFSVNFNSFHTREFFSPSLPYHFAYPAPMGVLYKLVYVAFPNQEVREDAFLGLVAATMLAGILLLSRQLTRRGLTRTAAVGFCCVTVLLSYPIVFEAKQGNLEVFVFLLIGAGVWLFLRGRGYSSAACFALAGSLKLFPLIFLGLHIAQRRWRPLLLGLALVPVISVASLWLMAPDIPYAWSQLQSNLAEFQGKIVLHIVAREIGFDHSLFSLLKRVLTPSLLLLRVYMAAAALGGIALFFLRIRRLPITNQVLALAVAAIFLPPVSYDYTLIHLYIPLTLITLLAVDSARLPRPVASLGATLLLLAVALSPLSELNRHGLRFGGQVRALVLLALFMVACAFPLQEHQPPAPLN